MEKLIRGTVAVALYVASGEFAEIEATRSILAFSRVREREYDALGL